MKDTKPRSGRAPRPGASHPRSGRAPRPGVSTHLVALAALALILASPAAVPLKWTVETSRVQPVVFDVVHGESIALEAALQSYGKPLPMTGKPVAIYWQTNGMDSAWWSASAEVRSTNVLAATFTPAMDPGASTVTAFLGATGDIYRAAFTLRFRKGPGATPNVIEQPPRILDLARTVVINPPWPTQADFAASTTVMKAELKTYVDSEIEGAGLVSPQFVTNTVNGVVTKQFVEGLGIESGLDTNAVATVITNHVSSGYLATSNALSSIASSKRDVNDLSIQGSPWVVTSGLGDQTDVSVTGQPYYDSERYGCWVWKMNSTRKGVFYGSLHSFNGSDFEHSTSATFAYTKPGGLAVVRLFTAGRDCLAKISDTTNTYTRAESDARYAPTSTAATVATQASQLSQLSQSVSSVSNKADQANAYSSGIYQYMNGNTNAWFSGTNYVTNADATNRTHFVWETGMDASTVPCSFALWEIRDGQRQQVWDQRDWTVWYWNFKAAQMRTEIAETNAAIYAYINSTNNHAWARRYAASGRINPDRSTTYVDTPKICLSPGMNWETVAEVSGCGYWTIVGNGAIIGGSGTNAVLQIKDFEGNEVMTVTKGSHQLVWLDQNDFTGQMTDASGWVCFDMMSDSQPVGYFSTTLEAEDFTAETSANCPAQYRWENLGNGEWRVHFLLKPGIVSGACFAKFQAETQGQTTIRYNAGLVISGGLIYNGVKIVPVIPNNASAGTTITWVVAQ